MGFPSENFERFYRNPMNEVQRFFEQKHKGKYKLWNLCAERHYDKECFHGRVCDSYQFFDHEAPTMDIIVPFCISVHEWLNEDPENIAVIHCKAGKVCFIIFY
jgi:phosphatidylinositol-3,4,5-trisphosphate 3-phosphatase/dual-specificity protein phosphatase PTEN